MEIGNQIKSLRRQRGITQEQLAQTLNVSAQAVSKWERGAAAPDIELLPDISAFFGVSIDTLFALSDDSRMERIQNMIWDVRCFDPADVETSREFLLEKARREPQNGRPHELLADMEHELASQHMLLATDYAREALRRDPQQKEALSLLVSSMGGKCWDWCESNHTALIRELKDFIRRNPEHWSAHMWLIDQLMDDCRFPEAEEVMERFAQIHDSWRVPLYRGILAWHEGKRDEAHRIWTQLLRDYPQQWNVADTIADYLAREGSYSEAIAMHRQALSVSAAPRYSDPLHSIAQLCELNGDIPGAIRALEETLDLYASDWGFRDGETADSVRREIARLQESGNR